MPGAADAVTQAARLPEIGFAEFTSQLITDTFDALIAANIRQTESYIKLLRVAAQTLQQFINNTQDDIGAGEILAFLAQFPEAQEGGTLTAEARDQVNNALALPDSAVTGGNRVAEAGGLTGPKFLTLQEAAAKRIAANKYDLLKEIVRQGALRLVVDNGVIETRLTFSTYGKTSDSTSFSDRNRESSESGGASGLAGGGGAIGTGAGFGVGGGFGSFKRESSLRVTTAKESHRDVNGSNVQIFGRVEIRFKTDFLPLNP